MGTLLNVLRHKFEIAPQEFDGLVEAAFVFGPFRLHAQGTSDPARLEVVDQEDATGQHSGQRDQDEK